MRRPEPDARQRWAWPGLAWPSVRGRTPPLPSSRRRGRGAAAVTPGLPSGSLGEYVAERGSPGGEPRPGPGRRGLYPPTPSLSQPGIKSGAGGQG
ncbi:hypothetical protein chiPu_0027629 [Chiloscyllium punctatum]|uniref:Uncharacterized protein n=1 Tax=Chiloscyllium punctatum TaxID=137246 RepID=A0A401TL11_CHIPU|nr:hypothetical protein [Chiloscyllium punctatum]